MNEYRGKHAPSTPWAVASTASVPVRRSRHLVKNRRRRVLIILALLVFLALIVYPFVEARILTTDKVALHSDDLPADANHLRIVYLSDIHWGFWFSDSDLNNLIVKINSLRPDLVLFGGDYATDHESAILFFRRLQELTKVHARYGIFGVPGETDRGEDNQDRTLLSEAMSNAGVTPLINKVEKVQIGSGSVCIAGLDDTLAGKPDLKTVSSQVSARDYVIPLCHNLNLTGLEVWFEMIEETPAIRAFCRARTSGKTGVEMEALTGVQTALLTVYDMCKAVDKRMVMTNVHLLHKTGGKSGDFHV